MGLETVLHSRPAAKSIPKVMKMSNTRRLVFLGLVVLLSLVPACRGFVQARVGIARPGLAPGRTTCTSGLAGAREVSAAELEKELVDWEIPMILDVYAIWCGPCQLIKPELEKAADALEGKVRVLKLNSDEEPDMARALRVYGLPTLIYMKDGEIVYRTEGYLPAQAIMDLAGERLLGIPAPAAAGVEATDPADELFIEGA